LSNSPPEDALGAVERGFGLYRGDDVEPAVVRQRDDADLIGQEEHFEHVARLFRHRDAVGVDRLRAVLVLPLGELLEPAKHALGGLGDVAGLVGVDDRVVL